MLSTIDNLTLTYAVEDNLKSEIAQKMSGKFLQVASWQSAVNSFQIDCYSLSWIKDEEGIHLVLQYEVVEPKGTMDLWLAPIIFKKAITESIRIDDYIKTMINHHNEQKLLRNRKES